MATPADTAPVRYAITCHCGAAAQTVTAAPSTGLNLCHCDSCRRNTGVLCVSYTLIAGDGPSTAGLRAYQSSAGFQRFFCGTCGCHVFWRWAEREAQQGPSGNKSGRAEGERGKEDGGGSSGGGGGGTDGGEVMWAVATGVISGIVGEEEEKEEEREGRGAHHGHGHEHRPVHESPGGHDSHGSHEAKDIPPYRRHFNVAGTKDGGLAPWIEEVTGQKLELYRHAGPDDPDDVEHGPVDFATMAGAAPQGQEQLLQQRQTDDGEGDNSSASTSTGTSEKKPKEEVEGAREKPLLASCHCGTVSFHITRPSRASRDLHSPFPDLMIPYNLSLPVSANADDVKWWLRQAPGAASNTDEDPTRYLAGTCACRSCRLISGFEIQTWAFVPCANIFFRVPSTVTAGPEDVGEGEGEGEGEEAAEVIAVKEIPLSNDFSGLPPGILSSYESSPGTHREWCATCGATVFWRADWRAGLVDVSTGLLRAPEGARAERWLDWWVARVSFSEEVARGRYGTVAARAKGLIDGLEMGIAKVER
ncbi:hypothetical protein BX600DRAFT_473843 [Xylariales sp. PMI_506]|nr:hypothetical protein BX600DRAFT_473843 [Xylariales sp. PMI_506]